MESAVRKFQPEDIAPLDRQKPVLPLVNPRRVHALDGVRGLAVVEVFLYHARIPKKNAGWIGVELFLALSGFVITRSLFNEWAKTGGIKVWSFIKRRVARIYPGLIFLIFGYCLAAGLYFHKSVKYLLSESVPPFLGVANFTRALGLKFPKDLGQLWSVSLEFQLYLLWAPIVLFLLRRSPPKRLLTSILLIATCSFLYRANLVAGGNPKSFIYNNTLCRALPFLLGSFAAILIGISSQVKYRAAGITLFVAALLFHFYEIKYGSLSHWSRRDLVPLLLSVSSAVIVWGVAVQLVPAINRVFTNPVINYLGNISYGVFLWHYPILMLLPYRGSEFRVFLAAGLSVLLGAISFELVEKRFIRKL